MLACVCKYMMLTSQSNTSYNIITLTLFNIFVGLFKLGNFGQVAYFIISKVLQMNALISVFFILIQFS